MTEHSLMTVRWAGLDVTLLAVDSARHQYAPASSTRTADNSKLPCSVMLTSAAAAVS